jgi:hypothetical protein
VCLCIADACPAADASLTPIIDQPFEQGIVDEPDPYSKTLERRQNRSKGTTTDTDSNENMMEAHAEEMFTPDAWQGMKRCDSYEYTL